VPLGATQRWLSTNVICRDLRTYPTYLLTQFLLMTIPLECAVLKCHCAKRYGHCHAVSKSEV